MCKQRALPHPRLTHNRDTLAFAHRKFQAAKHTDHLLTVVELASDPARAQPVLDGRVTHSEARRPE